MERDRAKLRVGPAGWSYADWKGIVYPPGMPRSTHPAAYLAQFFDTIEVNSTFYRIPDSAMVTRWASAVADYPNFRYTAKLWQGFTHDGDTWPGDFQVQAYLDGITPLVERGLLGAVLIQFPWKYRRTDAHRRHLARIVDAFSSLPLCVEFRHESWHQPTVLATLQDRGIAFCNVDQPLFPNSLQPTNEVTAPLAYVRFHGRNKDNWFREGAGRDARYDYLYDEGELAPWNQRISQMLERAKEVYVVTNNHFRGQAIVNAFDIQHAQTGLTPRIPESLLAAYPHWRLPSP